VCGSRLLLSQSSSVSQARALTRHALRLAMSLLQFKMHYHRQQTGSPALHVEFKNFRKRPHTQPNGASAYSWERVLTYAQEMMELSRRANQHGLSNEEWRELTNTISMLELCVRMLRSRFEEATSHLPPTPIPSIQEMVCQPVPFAKQNFSLLIDTSQSNNKQVADLQQNHSQSHQVHVQQHYQPPPVITRQKTPSPPRSRNSPTSFGVQERKCTECGVTDTPEWRRGSNGKTLCNACGIRFRRRNKRVKQLESQRIRDRTSIKALLN